MTNTPLAPSDVEAEGNALPTVETAQSDRALMEQYLEDPANDYYNLQYGDIVDGVIMQLDRDEILVDIGSKAEGIVPSKEMSSLTPEEREQLLSRHGLARSSVKDA